MKKIIALVLLNVILFANLKCKNKHKCSQMKSCKEAYFYLNVCGIKKLDRDKDGIPCEKLCN